MPILFLAHSCCLEEREIHGMAYTAGIGIGMLVLLGLSCFSISADNYNFSSLYYYWFYWFFWQTCIPAAFVIILYNVVAAFISDSLYVASSSVLFGFVTVKMYTMLFAASSAHQALPLFFVICIYASSLFICDAVIFCCESAHLSKFAVVPLSFCAMLIVCGIGFCGLSLWYFKASSFVFTSIFIGVAASGLFMHYACNACTHFIK